LPWKLLQLAEAGLATVFEIPEGEPIVAADPDDDIFLRCAVVAGALYVVSGDHHLLGLGTHVGIPIVTIRDFLANEFPDAV
jgi:predicted nucleic acid-binding protein